LHVFNGLFEMGEQQVKIGMILGLVGGVLALILGVIIALVGGVVGGVASQVGQEGVAARSGLLVLGGIGLPLMAIVGSAILNTNLKAGLICMAIPAALIVLLAISSGGYALAALGALIGAGAYFAWAEGNGKVQAGGDGRP
jgi:hypothetical protein